MMLGDAPAALRGLLDHNNGCIAASPADWTVARVPHPTDSRVARIVLSCAGCGAGHLYDVSKLATVTLDEATPARRALRVVRS